MKNSIAVKSLAAGLTAALTAGPAAAQVVEARALRAPLGVAAFAASAPTPFLAPALLAPSAAASAPAFAAASPFLAVPAAPAALAAAAPAPLAAQGPAAVGRFLADAAGSLDRPSAGASSAGADAKSAADARFDGSATRPTALDSVFAAPSAGPQAGGPGTARFSAGAGDALKAQVTEKAASIARLRAEIGKVIVGQKEMVESIVMAMIASEHVFLEGMPGVAKTQAVKASADAVAGDFKRIQGTPDKLPSDIIGTEILQDDAKHKGMKVVVVKFGPVFTNILLVDEINRMPPKTQASLLEAMAEGQVTIGDKTYKLGKPFIVLATQNPIEQEGTYRLPEAQQDRFMLKVVVPRPSMSEILEIMERFASKDNQPKAGKVSSLKELDEIRRLSDRVYVDPAIKSYIAHLVEATHNPAAYGIELKEGSIEKNGGASPRAAIYLLKAARIHALIEGRAWVGPEDVAAVAARILRHRIILGFAAPRDLTTDAVIETILQRVPVPGETGAAFVGAAVKPRN